MDEELFWLPAHELRGLFMARKLSPLEFAHATLARIDRLDKIHHAFITVDHENVIAQARRAQDALGDPERLGALHGVPVSVKDTIPTARLRTTYASLVYKDLVPDDDAVPIARLRAAGAIILGKTNTTEFALQGRTRNRLVAETVNPWRKGLSAGGSSGGAAASVALGLNAIAIGGDDGGSIRLPAALCGVYGFCPSGGRVPHLQLPRQGGFVGQLFQRTGPLTRDVADARLATRIMAGQHPSDPFSLRSPMRAQERFARLSGVRAAWVEFSGAAQNRAVIENVHGAAARLDEIGLVRLVDEDAVIQLPFEAFMVVMMGHVGPYFRELMRNPDNHALLTPESLRWADHCKTPATMNEELAAWRSIDVLRHRLSALFERHDVLMTPTFGDVAPPILDSWDALVPVTEWAAATFAVNGSGLCAASVPCGFVDGLPVGLQIIAPQGSDDLVFDLSRAIERHFRWAQKKPAAE